jgi:hypothetical protein
MNPLAELSPRDTAWLACHSNTGSGIAGTPFVTEERKARLNDHRTWVCPGLKDPNGGVFRTSESYLKRRPVNGLGEHRGLSAWRSRAIEIQMATVHSN